MLKCILQIVWAFGVEDFNLLLNHGALGQALPL